MSGVLSNAASAASAAAEAASAAASAARAAAAAASTAVEAINAVLPPSQRVAVPAKQIPAQPAVANGSSAGNSIGGNAKVEAKVPKTEIPEPLPVLAEDGADRSIGAFSVPSEQSLAGLVGTVEIPVSANEFSGFGSRIGGPHSLDEQSVSNDPESSLKEAIGAGRGFSRETLAAEERANQARAQSGQALANLLPSLSVRKNTGRETSAPSAATDSLGNTIAKDAHHRTDSIWTLRQALFDAPSFFDYRRRGVIESARDESRRAADGDAYLASVNAYLSLISTKILADMARDFERKLNELLVYVDKRAAAGAATTADMARVRARSKAAISSLLEQESAHTAAGVEFVRLTNLAPKVVRLPDLDELGANTIPESVDQAIEISMSRNPDIASLISESEAAEIDKTAARSRFLPRFDLELSDNKSVHAQGNPSPDGQRDKRAMLVMSWSLLNGGGDYQYGKERSARHLELKYRLDDQRRRVVQSLLSQYATLRATRERLTTGYQELMSITTAAEAMSVRMLSGNQSLLDLLDTYERHYQSRVRLVNMHVQEMASVAQIVRLVQGVPSKDKYTSPAISGMPESSGLVQGNTLLPRENTISPSPGGRRDELVVVPELLNLSGKEVSSDRSVIPDAGKE